MSLPPPPEPPRFWSWRWLPWQAEVSVLALHLGLCATYVFVLHWYWEVLPYLAIQILVRMIVLYRLERRFYPVRCRLYDQFVSPYKHLLN